MRSGASRAPAFRGGWWRVLQHPGGSGAWRPWSGGSARASGRRWRRSRGGRERAERGAVPLSSSSSNPKRSGAGASRRSRAPGRPRAAPFLLPRSGPGSAPAAAAELQLARAPAAVAAGAGAPASGARRRRKAARGVGGLRVAGKLARGAAAPLPFPLRQLPLCGGSLAIVADRRLPHLLRRGHPLSVPFPTLSSSRRAVGRRVHGERRPGCGGWSGSRRERRHGGAGPRVADARYIATFGGEKLVRYDSSRLGVSRCGVFPVKNVR